MTTPWNFVRIYVLTVHFDVDKKYFLYVMYVIVVKLQFNVHLDVA